MLDEFAIFAFWLVVLWFAAQFGGYLRRRLGKLEQDERDDLAIVLTASLTLLGLIVGFSFSMAVTRYNQRKDCEVSEANAIRVEYSRADLLPEGEAARVRQLLKSYAEQRIHFYLTRDSAELEHFDAAAIRTQADLWKTVQPPASARPTPLVAMALSGINDLMNTYGEARAAWLNRIPFGAWSLMGAIAIGCNILIGFTARRAEGKGKRIFILPLLVSISILLVADIDNPHGGVILVHPLNLERVAGLLET